MLLVLLLFLGVCGPLFLLLFRLLFLLHLPQFLRQNLVVKFVLEFVPVELLDQFLDHGFNWDQLLIDFVVDVDLVDLFFVEFYHQDSILV
jgi:hypothetical protein